MHDEITKYHAKYFALELSKRSPSDSLDKFSNSLLDAKVTLNPHQVEAALFAFKSPLSKGAILADEVWLGKTIEAGILLSQKWAEKKRKILIIAPANLRKQWNQELNEKFYLPSVILETKSFNENTKRGNFNPFVQQEIVIVSYQFAKAKDAYVKAVEWDIVVIDEAHRLRNVYKPNNKIANIIKQAIAARPKVLLTATPLQNSLLELYGLVGIVDENVFWDQKSFTSQFSRAESSSDRTAFEDLRSRLSSVCKRTLRRDVLEYVNYTNRIALVEEFYQSSDEQVLYEYLAEYLSREQLYALPASQRSLMELILRRLLASSTYAIADTFGGLKKKLADLIETIRSETAEMNPEIERMDRDFVDSVASNFEEYDEFAEEHDEDEDDEKKKPKVKYDVNDIPAIRAEMEFLTACESLAKSIDKNSKGERLAIALQRGFEELEKNRLRSLEKKYPLQKALIFTESTRTQAYVKGILEKAGYAWKIVLFNGSNSDPESQQIYREWLAKNAGTDKVTGSKTADIRAALVEHFRDEAKIMIATEAAAEGLNLQFCSFIVNYDLPWNPQRIEQRIGRCHRYGQKADVVVLNFLNKSNAADQRVYELLFEKLKLFENIFDASDEVLGVIERWVDIERRIAQIYSQCRTDDAINKAFEELQNELRSSIDESLRHAHKTLLSNFDEEVVQKLKVRKLETEDSLNRYQEWLWGVTKFGLRGFARFQNDHSFVLERNPNPFSRASLGRYRMGKEVEDAHVYRIGHPLAEYAIQKSIGTPTPKAALVFRYSDSGKKISLLEPLVGTSGWIRLTKLTISAYETEDVLVWTAVGDDWIPIDTEAAVKLWNVGAVVAECEAGMSEKTTESLRMAYSDEFDFLIKRTHQRNSKYYSEEVEKLERWAEDQTKSLEIALKDVKAKVKEATRESKKAEDPAVQLEWQQKIQTHTREQQRLRREIFELEDRILAERSRMIDMLKSRMEERMEAEVVFEIRYTVA